MDLKAIWEMPAYSLRRLLAAIVNLFQFPKALFVYIGRKVLGLTGDQVFGGNLGSIAKGFPSVPFLPLNKLRDPSL